MTRLTPISAKKLIRLLERLGFREIHRKGSHRFFLNPLTRLTTTVPDHGSHDIGRGLLKSILRDIELSAEDFERLRNE